MSFEWTRAQRAAVRIWAKLHGKNPDHIEEHWSERAAIREYEGGMMRREAERLAAEDMKQ